MVEAFKFTVHLHAWIARQAFTYFILARYEHIISPKYGCPLNTRSYVLVISTHFDCNSHMAFINTDKKNKHKNTPHKKGTCNCANRSKFPDSAFRTYGANYRQSPILTNLTTRDKIEIYAARRLHKTYLEIRKTFHRFVSFKHLALVHERGLTMIDR